MRLAVIGGADIAFRRFMPALTECGEIEYAGVASRDRERALRFQRTFGGKVYDDYDSVLADASVDAVYIPLPPALHYEWGRRAIRAGKHVLLEKPLTADLEEAQSLMALAMGEGLALHENYMFLYHSQMARVREIVKSGELGELRLIRSAFGIPRRAPGDFRLNRALGGGALLDCGGYPIRVASELMGEGIRVTQADLVTPPGAEVDIYGSAVLEDDSGLAAQLSFGLDNAYQCSLEVWGSEATLIAPRIFTPPPTVSPELIVRSSTGERRETLAPDDSFRRSIEAFLAEVSDPAARERQCAAIARQARLQARVRDMSTTART